MLMITPVNEPGEAREGVKLTQRANQLGSHSRGKTMMPVPKAPINTNPYRPPVRLTSLDDTKLVVKSSEEPPTDVRSQSESHERETWSARRQAWATW